MTKTKKIVLKISGNFFRVVSTPIDGWPNKGALISGDDIKELVNKGFGVSIKK